MNIAEFTNILSHPKEIPSEQGKDLELIIDDFPYFQAAQFLYLNYLKKQNSFKYNNYLKKTAAYTTDRTVLFDFISENEFKIQVANDEVSEFFEVENLVIENSKPLEFKQSNKKQIESANLPIGTPFKFDFSDNHSFNEWLQISSFKPIQRELEKEVSSKDDEKNSTVKKSNSDLIEKFIASNPKIKPIKSYDLQPIAFDSTIEDESLMTETLAHVYLEQKKYQKAITAFTVLSLKYPEKSSFFANRIKAIEKLQEK